MQSATAPAKTVLLVDDERAIRQLIRLALIRERYEVIEAGDGDNALQVASRHPGPIHLMVTDVVMPGFDGYELARRLLRQRPETKVLYMSAYPAGSSGNAAATARGCFLSKPFDMSVLLAKIRKLLGNGNQ